MPRKPQPGPYIMRIEGLSTVDEPKALQWIDELDGSMQSAPAPVVHRHIPKAQAFTKAELMAAAGRVILRKAKIIRDPVPLIPKGKHIVGTLTLKNGTVQHILKANQPWRRV